jgi:hypothetical protein
MRHSTFELTGRYTRPRALDIEAAASMHRSLKAEGNQPESLAATGTGGRFSSRLLSEASGAPSENASAIGLEGQRISESFAHRTGRNYAGTAGDWRN